MSEDTKPVPTAKFCGECGAELSPNSEVCPACGTPVSGIKSSAFSSLRRRHGPAILIVIGLVLAAVLAIGAYANNFSDQTVGYLLVLPGLLTAVGFLWGAARLIKRLIKGPRRLQAAIGPVLLIIAVAIIYSVVNYLDQSKKDSLALLRNYVAETAAIKSKGDTDRASQDTQRARAKEIADAILVLELDAPKELVEYWISAGEWADSLAETKTAEEWVKAPDEPPPFSLPNLSQADAEGFFAEALEELKRLNEFGVYLYTIDDKEGLRYLASELLATKHWIEGLETAQAASAWNFIDRAYASTRFPKPTPTTRPHLNLCVKRDSGAGQICSNQIIGSLGPVIRSTYGYTVGESRPPALTSWDTNWQAIASAGVSLGGTGIQPSPDPKAQPPTKVQQFFSDCSGKQGTREGTSVKTRLPTTQGGWTCNYPGGGTSTGCWDFLTYTGQRFMGGAKGCKEQGLLPEPKAQGTNGKEVSWDGTYTLMSNGDDRCNSNIIPPQTFAPSSQSFTVRNNQVVGGNGQNLPIDGNGRAVYTNQVTVAGGRGSVTITYQFNRDSGGKVTVTGSWSADAQASAGSQMVTIRCSGTFRG